MVIKNPSETKATVWTPLVSNSTSDRRGFLISVTLARKNITAREVIDAIHPHGTALVMEDGKAWVRGTAIPPELLLMAAGNAGQPLVPTE